MKDTKQTFLKAPIRLLKSFYTSVLWSLHISWQTSKLLTLVVIVCEIITPLFSVAYAFYIKQIINYLSYATAYNTTIIPYTLFVSLAIIVIVKLIFEKLNNYVRYLHDERIENNLSLHIMRSSFSADVEHYDNPLFFDIIEKANRDMTSLIQMQWNVISLFSSIITFLVVFYIVCRSNIIYGITIAICVIPSAVISGKYTKERFSIDCKNIGKERKLSYYRSISMDRSFAFQFRLFQTEEIIIQKYKKIWQELFYEKKQLEKKRTVTSVLLECVPEITIILISIHLVLQIVKKKSTIGDYALYSSLLAQLSTSLYLLILSFLHIYDDRLRIENVMKIKSIPSCVKDNGNLVLSKIESIEFSHVSFSYPGTSFQAIKDISMQIQINERIAIVGLNGSGKSTLIKLLLRFYDPDSGEIIINNHSIKDYTIASLRSCFSVYFQLMSNFMLSIRENFTITDSSDHESDDIIQALKQCQCENIMEKADGSLEASLSKCFDVSGIELSAGEYQKLALARTFFRKHSVLILDEPSASLDPVFERVLFGLLNDDRSRELIVIYITHRLSNINFTDRIIVLENGSIIEDGKHTDLIKHSGRYSELYHNQKE